MKFTKTEVLLVAAIVAVLALLSVTIFRKKPKPVPHDETHLPFYQMMGNPYSSPAVEKGCPNCHCVYAFPLPKGHPPKDQCLSCHKMVQAK